MCTRHFFCNWLTKQQINTMKTTSYILTLVVVMATCNGTSASSLRWGDGAINHAAKQNEASQDQTKMQMPTSRGDVSLPELINKLGLTELDDLIGDANLTTAINGTDKITIFGPTNASFDALPTWVKKEILNVTDLTEILTFHVLPTEVLSKDLKNEQVVNTTNGKTLRINVYKHTVAPTVVTAQCARVNLSRVDNMAENGVVHVTDDVLLPPPGCVVHALSHCPDFKTLFLCVQKAYLTDALMNPNGPFTVFAPTEAAFARLPPFTIQKLIHNPVVLADVLKYHILSGTYCSAGLVSGKVKTLQGDDLDLQVSSAGVTVNGANVIYADGSIENGVIHAIDTVLLPPRLLQILD